MSVVMFPGGKIRQSKEEPQIPGGEIRQQRPKGLAQIFREWQIKYDEWLKGKGKSIEEGKKLAESKTGIEQAARLTLGEEAGGKVRQVTETLTGLDPLKQVTRVAVILIVAMIGVMALLQVMPVNLPAGTVIKKVMK